MSWRRSGSLRSSGRWWERPRRTTCPGSTWAGAPATQHCPSTHWGMTAHSATRSDRSSPGRRSTSGRVKARVDVSRAREAEAQAQYAQTVLLALQDVETSLVRYRTSRARVERIQDAASASERAAELARLRFSGGVADFLQVLDAERTQLEAQDQLAQGRTDAATAYAALYKALGGTWPSAN